MTQRILLVSEQPEHIVIFTRALRKEDLPIVAIVTPEDDLAAVAARVSAEMLIIDLDSPVGHAFGAIRKLVARRQIPVIMFVKQSDKESAALATQAGISAYVVDGLREERIGPILAAATARFLETQALRQGLEQAQTALRERKLIERAKGLLMQQRRCSEEEAYTTLRRLAMRQNRRLVDIARSMIDAASLIS